MNGSKSRFWNTAIDIVLALMLTAFVVVCLLFGFGFWGASQ